MESKYNSNQNHHGTNNPSSNSNNSSSSPYKRNPPEMYSSPQSSQSSKDKMESPPVPDSTTEPAPRPVQMYQEGDDVFYHADDGQLIFGSVGQVSGNSCQVLFGDGTQQWASFKRLKKLDNENDEESNSTSNNLSLERGNDLVPKSTNCNKNNHNLNSISGPSTSSNNCKSSNRPNSTAEFTCNSCGKVKRIAAKKASKYQGDAKLDFHCKDCKRHNVNPEISIIPIGSQLIPKNTITNMAPPQVISVLSKPCNPLNNQLAKSNKPCFHCEKLVESNEKVYCSMCYEPCHLMCLGLNPVPLRGDFFWKVLCKSCGKQIPDKKFKGVLTVRRDLADWADVGHMIISCLSVNSSEQMFNFDSQMLPFLSDNMESLHLPRIYRNVEEDARRKYLLNALKKHAGRFKNGQNALFWGLRETALDPKALIYQTAVGLGLKPKVSNVINTVHENSNPPNSVSSQSQTKQSNRPNQPSAVPQQFKNQQHQKEIGNKSLIIRHGSEIKINHLVGLEITPIPRPPMSDSSKATLSAKVQMKVKEAQAEPVIKTEKIKKERIESNESKKERKRPLPNGCIDLPTKRLKKEIEPISQSQVNKSSGAIEKEEDKNKNNMLKVVELDSSNTDSESEIIRVKKKRPLRILHRVAVKSPSKSPVRLSNDSDDEESSDSRSNRLAQDIKNIPTTGHSHAIKSSSKVPLTPMEFEQAKSEQEDENESDGTSIMESPKKLGRPPKQQQITPKTPLVRRLRKRKRTISDSNPGDVNEHKPNTTQIAADKIKKKIKSKHGLKTKAKVLNGLSRKMIQAIQICECGNKRILRDNDEDPANDKLEMISSSIYDGAVYGGYIVQCLPKTPLTEVDRKLEALKVISNLQEEAEQSIASILLRRGPGSETRSETRRKADIYYSRRKRDLNDFDSYDIIGKRMDPDGIVRYQVVWRHPGAPSYFTEDWETYYEQNFGWGIDENQEIKIPESPINVEGEDEDETSSGASSGFPVILDLTE